MTDPHPVDPAEGVDAPDASAPAGGDPTEPDIEDVVDGEVVERETADAADVEDVDVVDAEGVEPVEGDLAAERLADLQRLQAEYVNYKRRVDRDRVAQRESAVGEVLESLLPTLDEIHLAREHGDLTDGPFRSIADKLEASLGRYGLERFGAKGEPFDPARHEALMHAPWPQDDPDLPAGTSGTTVVTVLQPGYLAGERVLRAARVAVADPE